LVGKLLACWAAAGRHRAAVAARTREVNARDFKSVSWG
jgi:hypothetical protein